MMVSSSNSLFIISVFIIILNFVPGLQAVTAAVVAATTTNLPVVDSSSSTTTMTATCSQHSAQDSDDFWVSVARCTACTQTNGCGFCQSTLQCLSGDAEGPSSGLQSCPSWSYTTDTCPALPHCELFTDCASCAVSDQCAWCASEGVCTTISEAFSRDCRGLVFEPPCPDQYISDNVIVGNLIVRADPTFGGGELNVSGAALSADGTQYVQYSMVLDEGTFAVQSGSSVRLSSGTGGCSDITLLHLSPLV